jgi:hypothetical protein
MPGWKRRTDSEIHELAREVLAGRVLGTWSFPTWPELREVFPNFLSNREWSLINAVHGGYYSTADAATTWADMPMIAQGFVYRRPDGTLESSSFSFHELELLSLDDWNRLAPLIGFPKGL